LRILVVKLNHLGDTLLMTPALRLLRQRFPQAWIDVVVRSGGEAVLEGNPDVSQVMTVPGWRALATVLRRRYAYAFDLSNSDRAKVLVLASGAEVRGINARHGVHGWRREVFNRVSMFDWAREHQVLRDFRTVADVLGVEAVPGPLVLETGVEVERPLAAYAVIHPTSRWAYKQWLPERWAAVADFLAEKRGLQVLFSHGPGESVDAILEKSRIPHLKRTGLSLRQLGRLIQGASLFLGVDTVAMHVAAAVQAPTVALFGPSSEWSWHPWQVRHALVLGECTCKATRQFVCDKSRIYPCMERIETAAVCAAAEKLLR
jgi:heptosyltransferase-3